MTRASCSTPAPASPACDGVKSASCPRSQRVANIDSSSLALSPTAMREIAGQRTLAST